MLYRNKGEDSFVLHILLTNTDKPNSSWESITHDFSPVFGARQNKDMQQMGDNIHTRRNANSSA